MRRMKPSPALLFASLALLVALGGTSYAAFKLPKNSVGTAQLKNGAVTGKKIKNHAVTAAKINPAGLTVPNASQAANASLLGGFAASHFLPATGTAANSLELGGHGASFFVPTTGRAANSLLLGGFGPSHFLPTTGTAPNSLLLGGFPASHFLPANGTAADSSALGGFPAATFYRLRGEPLPNVITTPDIDNSGVGQFPSATVGTDGLPLIAYDGLPNFGLKVLDCGDAACSPSSSTITTVDGSNSVDGFTSVAIGSDGHPLISYAANNHLQVIYCGELDCSGGNVSTTVDAGVDTGTQVDPGGTSVAAGADGLPVIAYYDKGNTALKVAHCGTVVCSSGDTLTTVDNNGSVGGQPSLAIGADGLPVISYLDSGNAELKVLHCGNAGCSSGNTITTVDVGGDESSVAIGVDGLPVISHFSNNALKVLHCGSLDCGSGDLATTVDSAGIVGLLTSLAIGADGLPVVSYVDNTNGTLKVLHCGSIDCSSGDTANTVAGGQTIGFTSLTIGADGLPLVSYLDFANDTLNVLHCANVFCVPYFRRR